jgi:hypothetical protein
MAELRKLRDLQVRLRRLSLNRDTLIREAIDQGRTQRQIAIAAGLSQPQIHKIKVKGGETS